MPLFEEYVDQYESRNKNLGFFDGCDIGAFQDGAFQDNAFQTSLVAPIFLDQPAFQADAFQPDAFQDQSAQFTRNDQPYFTSLYNTDQFLDPIWGYTVHDNGSQIYIQPDTSKVYLKQRTYSGQSGGYISYKIDLICAGALGPPPPPPPTSIFINATDGEQDDVATIIVVAGPAPVLPPFVDNNTTQGNGLRQGWRKTLGFMQVIGFVGGGAAPPPMSGVILFPNFNNVNPGAVYVGSQ